MIFETFQIYHIYNQGNNRQRIYYSRENYLFFIRKIRTHILPFADILAWCLMPNHFHLMVEVRVAEMESPFSTTSEGFTPSETLTSPETLTGPDASSETIISREGESIRKPATMVTLNQSIGILLRSYTRAINIQEKRTGSLFRKNTKAICVNEINGIISDWYSSFGVTIMKVYVPEYQYPQVCFNYIHSNPVKAGLVAKAEDWAFSSCIDLVGIRDGTLVNRERVDKLGLIY